VQGRTDIHSLVLWGATLPPDLDLAASRERLAALRLRLVIGETDQYISGSMLSRERERLTNARIPFDVVEYDAGHSIKRAVLQEVAERVGAG
jgi:predicted esterase